MWQLFPAFLLVTLASVAALTWHAASALKAYQRRQTETDLLGYARLLQEDMIAPLRAGDREAIERIARDRGQEADLRVTVVAEDGTVLGDSWERPQTMDNHGDRPEVIEAKTADVGIARRYSYTVKAEQLYVAVPIVDDGARLGVLRVALNSKAVDAAIRALVLEIGLGGLAVSMIAAAVSWWLAKRLTRPLEELRSGAERFARGDLDRKLPTSDTVEIGTLAETLNQMAAALDERIRALMRQRNEGRAVLASMVEGVIAVDSQERVIRMNDACAQLLGVDAEKSQGRSLQEVVRNRDLQQLVAGVLGGQEPAGAEIAVHQPGPRSLEAHGTVLRDAGGHGIGVLVVLHDVTRVRKLESVRRDFVANVSHELRTPITSIQGFVETLLDGALDNPKDARRFLEIIAAQTDRLGAIIEDLLMLSRIEQEHEKAEIALEQGRLEPIVRSAVGVCQCKADEKQIRLDVRCDADLQALINPTLMEQALVNLIDNAIKYSTEGQVIQIEVERLDNEIQFRVRDSGCGIAREHLSRIFERFYRVDKARSRKLGGTGLGLAIVKHIAQSHGGQATVESTVGQGSTFTLHLPAGR
jgi:two-component system phosphate regulon sensor histidine kinase PhoR